MSLRNKVGKLEARMDDVIRRLHRLDGKQEPGNYWMDLEPSVKERVDTLEAKLADKPKCCKEEAVWLYPRVDHLRVERDGDGIDVVVRIEDPDRRIDIDKLRGGATGAVSVVERAVSGAKLPKPAPAPYSRIPLRDVPVGMLFVSGDRVYRKPPSRGWSCWGHDVTSECGKVHSYIGDEIVVTLLPEGIYK